MGKTGVFAVAVAVLLVVGLAVWDRFPSASAKDTALDTDSNGPIQIVDTVELMKIHFYENQVMMRTGLDKEPKGKEWRVPYIGSASIAESTNLLFSREGEDYMKTDEWLVAVKVGRKAAIDLCGALMEMDYEKSIAKYFELVETCNACHDEFEPEDATLVEAFL